MYAITSTFKSGEPSLEDLLKDIHTGKTQLPDFQRGWVWDDDHIRSLIASVSLSYPIGAVMLLQTGGDGAQFQPRLVQGVKLDGPKTPETLILDGQQRMTSLYLALLSGRPVPTQTAKRQPIERFYYLDIARCLDHAAFALAVYASRRCRRRLRKTRFRLVASLCPVGLGYPQGCFEGFPTKAPRKKWESPRLCRGGTQSLTFPGV